MADPNEIAALQASFRGALRTAEALRALQGKVEGLDPAADIAAHDLEELARASAAHSIASAALRGLVGTMLARRDCLNARFVRGERSWSGPPSRDT